MNPIQAAGLGILQGLTEFLPISSSGHLVLVQSLLPGFSQPGVLFDTSLHLGTMLAVFAFLWRQILRLDRKMLGLLLLASLPAGLVGVLFQSGFEALFLAPKAVGFALIFTGAANFLVDRFPKGRKEIGIADTLLIGIAQAAAIIPGISRSGATIFAAVFRGVSRREAATFSFLLSVPAIAGAAGWQLLSHSPSLSQINLLNYALGIGFAGAAGYLSIALVFRLLLAKNFTTFALYCFLLGGLAILFL